jgi:hypothetical protein
MFANMFNILNTNVVDGIKMKTSVGATVEACMQVPRSVLNVAQETPSVRTRCKACSGSGCQRVRIMDMEMMTQCTGNTWDPGTILGTECTR